MFERKSLQKLDDYFVELDKRQQKGTYFYRIGGYNFEIDEFLQKYYDVARRTGAVFEGKIPNPDMKNLDYFNEIMGNDFKFDLSFLETKLKKWLPRLNEYQIKSVSSGIFKILGVLKSENKTDAMIKNAYIKFMCWLYYRLEQVVSRLGDNVVPKILYEGEISRYELDMLNILSVAGCDIVILYKSEEAYRKIDKNSDFSSLYNIGEQKKFTADFSIKTIRQKITEKAKIEPLYGTKSPYIACTNVWIRGDGLDDIKTPITSRGDNPNWFYNAFYRINGVEDKLTYENELFQFWQLMKNVKRRILVLENEIPVPTMDEISSIKRNNYQNHEQLLRDLVPNIQYTPSTELQRLMVRSFIDTILEETQKQDSINKLTSKAVYLLCWLRRYQNELFGNWKMPEISVFIYLGGCKNEFESLFLRMLAKLPSDVIVLVPDKNHKCELEDKTLYELNLPESLSITKFPMGENFAPISTVAYHAERELDTFLYNDTGLYRTQQYNKANTIVLKTTYEEVGILWNEELKYRPSFSTTNNIVNIPSLFVKISGVKGGDISEYWVGIKKLLVDDTFLIDKVPFIKPTDSNPIKPFATEFFKNKRLQRQKIKEHRSYQYSFLRDETQEYILDKIALLIENKLIKGTFEFGVEYTIVSTLLNLDKEILRLIQKFDFTKKNPKLVYINTGEENISLEDSILVSFLNLIGFDISFFVPTGYQSIERHFNEKTFVEHQLGDYVYDLQAPDFNKIQIKPNRQSWREIIFGKGK